MSTVPSIFEKIARLASDGPLPDIGSETLFSEIPSARSVRKQKWQPSSVEESIRWLQSECLTRTGRTYKSDPSRDPASLLDPAVILGVPSHRSERRRKAELDQLKKKYKEQAEGQKLSQHTLDKLWSEYKDPSGAIRSLDIHRLPADALAFYRPFHFSPHEEWGIYIMVERLLEYCQTLYQSFGGQLAAFNLETLLGCVLFEVFHHEFFHHLTECAATTMEIVSAGFGEAKPIFSESWEQDSATRPGLGRHVDHPLEEALANAYAYNSFSFLSRMQIGYKLVLVKLYQRVLGRCWPKEPQGYRSAGSYINAGYVSSGAQLLAMILSSSAPDVASLMLLAKTVLPSGNSAFLQKPDVPTYLVGSNASLEIFWGLVPAPNETYTSLFWLGDATSIDEYMRERKKKEAP